MNDFTSVFLVALCGGIVLQYWLIARQAVHLRAHAGQVPEPFSGRIDLDAHRKAAEYGLAKLGVQRWDLALSAAVLLGWTLGGGIDLLDRSLAQLVQQPLWHGTLLIVVALLIGGLIDLPLSAWRTFGVEARFGFNRTTLAGFVRDRLLGAALMLLLGIPLVAAILWLMQRAGSLWWIWAWGLWMAFSLFVTWAYPVWIAPLFNRFEPLHDAALRARLEALLGRCGFRSNGMFVMDGSRRSAHGNAYFTGFGANKRIVFFDTLLEGLEADEVEAVLAHELGHYKRRHITQRLVISAVTSLAGLALLGWLAQQPWFYAGLGVSEVGAASALLLFVLVMPVFTVFTSPLLAHFSRRHEFEADDFAAEQTDPRHLINGLVKMYRDNASPLSPDPLYSAFYHSHPPALVRVTHLSSKIPA